MRRVNPSSLSLIRIPVVSKNLFWFCFIIALYLHLHLIFFLESLPLFFGNS